MLTLDRRCGNNVDKVSVKCNPDSQEGVNVVRSSPFAHLENFFGLDLVEVLSLAIHRHPC